MAARTQEPYDPSRVRLGGDRVPSYIWTGHEPPRAEGRVIRPRGIPPNWHLILTLSGKGSFRQPGLEHPMVRGDLILFTPGCYQDYGPMAGQTWENLFAHFAPRPHWLPWMRWPKLGEGLFGVSLGEGPEFERVLAAMQRCHGYAHASFSSFAHELALSALEEALLLGAHQARYGQGGERRSGAIGKAVEAITSRLADRHSVRSLARIAGLSSSRFSHLFKQETGESVIGFINRLRIREGARLLEAEGLSVKEAASAVGYSSPFYFSRQFRKFYFIDPSGFRRNAGARAPGK